MEGVGMLVTNYVFEALGSRESFNTSVRHVKATVGLSERVAGGENLADAVNALLDEKALSLDEVAPLVSMLLVDKLSYVAVSRNLSTVTTDLKAVHAAVKSWNAADFVVLYHHPDLGCILLNPKNESHLARLDRLNKYELITVYAGGFAKGLDAALARKAALALVGLYEGDKPKADASLGKGPFSYRQPKPKVAPRAEPAKKAGRKAAPARKGKKKASAGTAVAEQAARAPAPAAQAPKMGARMTPMYAVPVSNELFHNGNVEAWKRIIESYKTKHPDLEVLVYYDGERITDINALFKWGKVKHGSVIQFAVAGENICDVAKLQRYLAQGASKMFEAFLRGPVNSVLPLF